jgi:hypothetical protein
MTHSLHRQGNVDSLKSEYVVLTFGDTYLLAKQRAFLRRRFPAAYALLEGIALRLGALRALQALRRSRSKGWPKGDVLLNSREELCACLRAAREASAGRSVAKSVVVSGVFDEVYSCLKEEGLRPHTVQFSLGCFGRTELLPADGVLELTTMCGHHMVSPGLAQASLKDVAKGKTTAKEAARDLAALCNCGIFNEARAARIIEDLAK